MPTHPTNSRLPRAQVVPHDLHAARLLESDTVPNSPHTPPQEEPLEWKAQVYLNLEDCRRPVLPFPFRCCCTPAWLLGSEPPHPTTEKREWRRDGVLR